MKIWSALSWAAVLAGRQSVLSAPLDAVENNLNSSSVVTHNPVEEQKIDLHDAVGVAVYTFSCRGQPTTTEKFKIAITLINGGIHWSKWDNVDALVQPTSNTPNRYATNGQVGFTRAICLPPQNGVHCGLYFSGGISALITTDEFEIKAFRSPAKGIPAPAVIKACALADPHSRHCPTPDPGSEHCTFQVSEEVQT